MQSCNPMYLTKSLRHFCINLDISSFFELPKAFFHKLVFFKTFFSFYFIKNYFNFFNSLNHKLMSKCVFIYTKLWFKKNTLKKILIYEKMPKASKKKWWYIMTCTCLEYMKMYFKLQKYLSFSLRTLLLYFLQSAFGHPVFVDFQNITNFQLKILQIIVLYCLKRCIYNHYFNFLRKKKKHWFE